MNRGEGWQNDQVKEENGGRALTASLPVDSLLILLLLSMIALSLNTHSAEVHVCVCKMTILFFGNQTQGNTSTVSNCL